MIRTVGTSDWIGMYYIAVKEASKNEHRDQHGYIPLGNEDTGFGLSLFPPIASKKICNRAGYYASF
jgi:hypothetical protein